ncbi:MAG: hypothetical protein BV456_07480 [Thermoplasmata archaeon M8B2D]|nr:MAG: hypothetical protein BV456_07480 [Thermoplasmata archaeon M8B2D]
MGILYGNFWEFPTWISLIITRTYFPTHTRYINICNTSQSFYEQKEGDGNINFLTVKPSLNPFPCTFL